MSANDSPLAITTSESGAAAPDPLAQRPGTNPLRNALATPTAKRGDHGLGFVAQTTRVPRLAGIGIPGMGAGPGGSGSYNVRTATDAIVGAGQQPGFAEGLDALDAEGATGSRLQPLDFRPSNRLNTRIIGVAGLAPAALPPPSGSFPPGSTLVMPAAGSSAIANPAMHARVYISAPGYCGIHVASPEERKDANARGRSGAAQCPSGATMGGAVITTRNFSLRLRGGAVNVPAGTVVIDPGEIYLLETQRCPMQPYDARELQQREQMPWEMEEDEQGEVVGAVIDEVTT